MSVCLVLSFLVTTAPPLAAQTRLEFTEIHMAIPLRVVVYAEDASAAREAARAAYRRVAELEHILSHFRPQSELRRLESVPAGEWVEVGPELFRVLARALEVARATEGAFDPTVGPLVELWREARASGRLPGVDALEAARARTGWRLLEIDPGRGAVRLARTGMRLDLGGVAKGYVLEAALAVLVEHGMTSALVEAGGDVVVGEAPPGRSGWRIEVGDGEGDLGVRASRLTHAALATSGANAQFVEVDGVRYSHVLDPRTGLGVTSAHTAQVLAEDAATADALATALSVLGPEGVELVEGRYPGVVSRVVSGVGERGDPGSDRGPSEGCGGRDRGKERQRATGEGGDQFQSIHSPSGAGSTRNPIRPPTAPSTVPTAPHTSPVPRMPRAFLSHRFIARLLFGIPLLST